MAKVTVGRVRMLPETWGVAIALYSPSMPGVSCWIDLLLTMLGWSSKTNSPGRPGVKARPARRETNSANSRNLPVDVGMLGRYSFPWVVRLSAIVGPSGSADVTDVGREHAPPPVCLAGEADRLGQLTEQLPVFMSHVVPRLPGWWGVPLIGVAKSVAVSIEVHAPR